MNQPIHDTPVTIGSIQFSGRLALAPMAGVTNQPFRRTCRRMGCHLGFTEMISTEGLLRSRTRTLSMVAHHESEIGGLGVQIFGDNPERLAEAAQWVQDNTPAAMLNINMGCPVDKVTQCNGGASLLKDPQLIGRIVNTVRRVCRLPLSIKIRAGWDARSLNYLEILKIAEDNGVDALMCHPRTRAQGYSGKADWSIISNLVAHARIPIFGNGDIFTPSDVRSIIRQTGCAAVLVARGANGNPWIFSALTPQGKETPDSVQEVGSTILAHLDDSIEHFGETLGISLFKRHLIWYSKWLWGDVKEFRRQAMVVRTADDVRALISNWYLMDREEVAPRLWWNNVDPALGVSFDAAVP